MADIVAINKSKQYFVAASTDGHSAAGGLETCLQVENARRFADQAAIDTYVSARGGSAGQFVALTLP